MTIEKLNTDKVKVVLSRQDMDSIGITYEELDYKEEDTRAAINDILDTGRDQVGFESMGYKLFVEVSKAMDGGCIFFFTKVEESQGLAASKMQLRRQSIYPMIMEFASLEPLCNYCRQLKSRKKYLPVTSTLYGLQDRYYLIMHIFKFHYSQFTAIANEYGDCIFGGNVAQAHIEEFGQLIADENAVEKMAQLCPL